MKYVTVIGLEIHAELLTKTKIFCGCKNAFGSSPNANCCPVCVGMPGALPILNRRAVELAIAAGLSFGCRISERTEWDRKNYFYPDLAKAYQISQLYAPLCLGGGLKIGERFIRLNRIHLEEDAGKLIHSRAGTLIDYNRAGVPLIEIVTEPDLTSADEAAEFVETVRRALVYAGVSDGRMEQGSLRVDANVSIMPEGGTKLGTRAEIKNINSFKFIKKAIEFEAARQAEVLNSGGAVIQETRRYDESSGETFSMRSKEDAQDYRYFPDPDVLPLFIEAKDVAKIGKALPESPVRRFERYTAEYGLSATDADILLENKPVSDFYDACTALGASPVQTANAVKGELLRCYNLSENKRDIPILPADFVRALELLESSKLTHNGLKTAVKRMYEGKPLDLVLSEEGLLVREDASAIRSVIRKVIDDNPRAAAQYRSGDTKVLSFLMGQCSRALKGAALAKTILEELEKALKSE